MAWDGVPWWIGGPAQHSREVARMLVYVGAQGAEGIIGIGDLVVRAQTPTTGSVQVLPGACVILDRYAGGAYQSYACRLPTTDTPITVDPTTTSTARSDLVIARVEDPMPAGSTTQPYPNGDTRQVAGPYVFSRVVKGVPAGTTDVHKVSGHTADSAITLARIDLPGNTTAVTQAMITDVRDMANPRSKMRMFGHSLVTAEAMALSATADTGQYWPGLFIFGVDVPTWAARASVRFEWSQVLFPGGSAAGKVWGRFGTDSTPGVFDTQRTIWDTTGTAGTSRASLSVADDVAIPAVMRGINITLSMRGSIGVGYAASVRPSLDAASSISAMVNFIESPADDAS